MVPVKIKTKAEKETFLYKMFIILFTNSTSWTCSKSPMSIDIFNSIRYSYSYLFSCFFQRKYFILILKREINALRLCLYNWTIYIYSIVLLLFSNIQYKWVLQSLITLNLGLNAAIYHTDIWFQRATAEVNESLKNTQCVPEQLTISLGIQKLFGEKSKLLKIFHHLPTFLKI